jgi:hypothetical protein
MADKKTDGLRFRQQTEEGQPSVAALVGRPHDHRHTGFGSPAQVVQVSCAQGIR